MHLQYEDIFPESGIQKRVILSEDRTRITDERLKEQRYKGHRIWRKVIHTHELPQPLPMIKPQTGDLPLQQLDRAHVQQYIDNIREGTIFTDGSYEKFGCPINTFFGLEHTTMARAAVVIQPRGERSMQANTVAIRIIDGQVIPGVNAFHMELLSAMVASKIRHIAHRGQTFASRTTEIWTDCKAVCDLANELPDKPWRHDGFPLLASIWRTNKTSAHMRWVRSHAERRLTQDKWTIEECGNIIADDVASDKPTLRPTEHIATREITTAQILTTLVQESKWTLTRQGLPVLTSPLELVQEARWMEYIQNRDNERTIQNNKTVKWQHLTLHAAAEFHDIHKASHTQRARISRIVYNWYFTGAKKAKCQTPTVGIQYQAPEKCPICKTEDDTQCHLICDCKHIEAVRVRETIMQETKDYINKELRPHTMEWNCATTICSLADTTSNSINPHYIWLGTWSPQQVQEVKTSTAWPEGKIADNHPINKVISTLGKIFARGTLAMLDVRHRILNKIQQVTHLLKHRQRKHHRSTVMGLTLPALTATTTDDFISNLRQEITTIRHKPTHKSHPITNLTPLNIPQSIHPTFQPLKKPHNHRTPDKPHLTPASKLNTPRPVQQKITTFTHTPESSTQEHDIGTRHVFTMRDTEIIQRYIHMQDSNRDIGFDPQGHSNSGIRTLTAMTVKVLRNYLIADVEHWLTGDNIDNIGDILNLSSPEPQHAGSYLFVNTRLMQQLYHDKQYNYSSVKNWGRARKNKPGINIFHYDSLYIPFNFTGMHWTGAIVKIKEKKIIYKDSMNDMRNPKHNGKGRTELHILKKYLTDDIHRRTGIIGREGITREDTIRLGKPTEWETVRNTRTNMIQENDSDCGICYLANMLYDTQKRPTSIHISHIPTIRKQLFILLMSYNTLPHHNPNNIHDRGMAFTGVKHKQYNQQTENGRENREHKGGIDKDTTKKKIGTRGGGEILVITHDNTLKSRIIHKPPTTRVLHFQSTYHYSRNVNTQLVTLHNTNHSTSKDGKQNKTESSRHGGWAHPRGGIG